MNTAGTIVFGLTFGLFALYLILLLIGMWMNYRSTEQPTDSLEALQRNWDEHVSKEAQRLQQQAIERDKGGR